MNSYFATYNEENKNYLLSLAEKQSGMYGLLHSKAPILTTTSSIFLGATTVIIVSIENGISYGMNIYTLNILLVFIFFLASLFITVFFVSPTKTIGVKKNGRRIISLYHHRASVGIADFSSKEEYTKMYTRYNIGKNM